MIKSSIYEIGASGKMEKIDIAANSIKNNLPMGYILHWGGNMGWRAQDYAVVERKEGSFGVRYNLISLETYSTASTEAYSIKSAVDKVWHGQHYFMTEKTLSNSELSELLKSTEVKKDHDKNEAQRKADLRLKEIERIKSENPTLKQVGNGEYASAKLAATNIRTELKKAFPKTKFSVRSEVYSGGDAVRIDWTDGPTQKQVESITAKYGEGHFDGMNDIYEYANATWPEVFGGAKYVTENRHYSDALIQDGIDSVHTYLKGNFDHDKAEKPTVEQYKNGNLWKVVLSGLDPEFFQRELNKYMSEKEVIA